MKTIAVVEKNSCQFDRLEEFAGPLLYKELDKEIKTKLKADLNNYLWSVVEPYITFVDIDADAIDEDFLEIVCQNMTKNFPDRKFDEFYYHTEGSYSFPKKYIEMIRCQPLWSEYVANQMDNMNNISCLFSLKQTVIENTCIIIANRYDLLARHFTVIDSVTKEDILRVIRRRFFFSAILIKENQLIKYYYQNPSYLVQAIYGVKANDNIEKLSISHLKYNLVFYFQHNKDRQVNQIATRINGLYRLHGDVLMLHELEDDIFANISIHEAKRINILSYGRLCDRELKKEEVHDVLTTIIDEKKNYQPSEKKITPFWSRYIVIDNRILERKKKKDECANCYGNIKTPVLCDKCYRIKYCSEKCMKEFSYHTDDCINPKSF